MKRYILLFLFFYTALFAKSNQYELKLYTQLLPSIFVQKPLVVFVDEETKVLLKESKLFHIVNECTQEVTLLIGKHFDRVSPACQDKPQFSTTYRSFKNDLNSFGAFYWRKGRPQIRFQQEVIDRYNLRLPESLKRYIR